VALAVGLVIGLERGWSERNLAEGTRVFGLRTFALLGLAGGIAAVLGVEFGVAAAAAILLGLGALVVVSRFTSGDTSDVGATTEVAAFVTLSLGVTAGIGYPVAAAAGAAGAAFLLGSKPLLHRWLRGIEQRELFALLQLFLISAVVLPLLPDAGFGPYGALNPYRLWWIVVLVSSLSFAGYVALKLFGARTGVLLTGFCGGLVSSTATTLTLVRRARDIDPSLHGAVTGGIAATTATMMVRMAVLAMAIDFSLFWGLVVPFGLMALVGAAVALFYWHRISAAHELRTATAPGNPLDLRAALVFGALLAAMIVAIRACQEQFGSGGLYVLSSVAALVDVDAITISVAQQGQIGRGVAVMSLFLAAAVNTLVKMAISVKLGPAPIARSTMFSLAAVIFAGASGLVVKIQ